MRDWTYLAEGNANVIFQYLGPSPTLHNHVLRLRKSSALNGFTPLEQSAYLYDTVVPAIPPNLASRIIPGSLYLLPAQSISNCIAALKEATESHLRPARHASSALDESATHGVLLRYLPSRLGTLQTLEFKPKWLTQSIAAPVGAVFCRTCAVNRMRSHERGEVRDLSGRYCPLDLLSSDADSVRRAIVALERDRGWDLSQVSRETVVRYLSRGTLISELRDAQIRTEESDLSLCMTLRDCSIYLVLDVAAQSVESFWIGDLDRKSDAKRPYWKSIEMRLVQGRWYMASPSDDDTWTCGERRADS